MSDQTSVGKIPQPDDLREEKRMLFSQKFHSTTGLTLIELMVVITIIGAIASLGIPRFRSFLASARQSEAKKNLKEIHTLQASYQLVHDKYLGWAGTAAIGNQAGTAANLCSFTTTKKIGFKPDNCSELRYMYWVLREDTASDGRERFHAFAYGISDAENRIFPTCAGKEVDKGGTMTTRAIELPHPDPDDKDNTLKFSAITTHAPASQGDLWGITERGIFSNHKNTVAGGLLATAGEKTTNIIEACE